MKNIIIKICLSLCLFFGISYNNTDGWQLGAKVYACGPDDFYDDECDKYQYAWCIDLPECTIYGNCDEEEEEVDECDSSHPFYDACYCEGWCDPNCSHYDPCWCDYDCPCEGVNYDPCECDNDCPCVGNNYDPCECDGECGEENKDCAGVANGSAYIDDCGNCVGGTTGQQPTPKDCCGNCMNTISKSGVYSYEVRSGGTYCDLPVWDCNLTPCGTAYIDNCSHCVGGTTGLLPCTQDCANVWGGSATIDNCGRCVGGTTGLLPCTQDCANVWGGSATIDNCGNCVGGTTGGTPCIQDCANVWGGTATIDNCGNCVSGTTGQQPCEQDCNGNWGGQAYTDDCGNCVSGTTGQQPCEQDCNGNWGGQAYMDDCNNCVGGTTGQQPCEQDCNGTWGGSAYTDDCNNCVGGTTGRQPCEEDCNGTPGGTAYWDECSICVGGTTGQQPCTPNNPPEEDCAGVEGGDAYTDNCGNCVGGTTEEEPCEKDCNGDWGGSAYIDWCENCVGGNTGQDSCYVPCPTTAADLKKMFPNATDNNMKNLAKHINTYANKYGIDTKEKLQHFLAQAGHETGGFNKLAIVENMNYTTETRLLSIFPKYFSQTDTTKRDPADYIKKPEELGNYVYADRNGNGDEASGDGYNYRGRGVFQLTGKDNYQAFQTHYNNADFANTIDLINNPALLSTNNELSVISAMWFYQQNVLNKMTVDENTDADDVTKKINGGTNGDIDRKSRTETAKQEIDCNKQKTVTQ